LAGIFLTPALLFRFFGRSIHLPFGFMCAKLCKMVLIPVGVGQVLRATPLLSFYNSHTKAFKRLQEVSPQNEKMILRTLIYCSYLFTLTLDYSIGNCLQCLLQCFL
jgi:predicted Na+-dependent transporter